LSYGAGWKLPQNSSLKETGMLSILAGPFAASFKALEFKVHGMHIIILLLSV